MKLIFTPTSPFARKPRVVAMERGVVGLEELVEHPLADGSRVPEFNPLGKVPALILDEGHFLVDSRVICEFLDQCPGAPVLVPADGRARFEVLGAQALADGAMDAAVSIVMEMRRPVAKRSPYWLQRWHDAVVRTLDVMEKGVAPRTEQFDLGTITWMCLLDYIDFRLVDVVSFRHGRPQLEAFWQGLRERPSLAATIYKV